MTGRFWCELFMRIEAKDYQTGQPIGVSIENGSITAVEPITDSADLPWVAPSFCDVQINGCLGHDFGSSRLTVEEVQAVTAECVRHGIGQYCPTIITGGFEAVRHGFRILCQAVQQDGELSQRIVGFHLEGPYLSEEDGPRGAHPLDQIRDPDWDEFCRWQEAAGGRIRMVTLAPERPGAVGFIEKLVAHGIVPAIGHTAATPEQLRAAVDAGARTSTHLGNGAHAQLARHPNIIWEQLGEDRLWASFIPDGHHLPASVVKAIYRTKSAERLLITCDASSLAGLPPGRYQNWGSEFEVLPNGKVVVPGTPFLAGSGVFTDSCVSTVIRQAGIGLAEAVRLAAVNPRTLLGVPVPKLEVGQPAQLVVFKWTEGADLVPLQTI